MNKLGTGAWEKLKEKTKKKIKDIARDLILLYSKRREEKGFQFSPDSFMQNELEASFLYEDTPDQSKATADVKADMAGYADILEGEDRLILKLRPGITGPASLKYRNEEEILAQVDDPQRYNDEVIYPDKVRINLDYYYHHSLLGDIKLIMKTIYG